MLIKFFKQHYKLLFILLLLLLGIAIYSNTFSSSFHFDDGNYITDNIAIRIMWLKGLWDFFPSRFITFLTFAINYQFSKLDVFGYHIFNFAIHFGSAILVWWFTNIIFTTPAIKKNELSRFSRLIAAFTALIFLSHPLQTESVTYIWQRCSSLSGLFYLFSLCFYLKGRVLQTGDSPVSKWKVFYCLSLISASIGMFTKENFVTLPLMIILCEFYFIKVNKHFSWKHIVPFLVLLLIIPLVLFFTKPETVKALQELAHQPINAGGSYFLTQLNVLATYIRLLFVPVNQNLDYDYPIVKSLINPATLASFFFLAAIIIVAIRMFSRYKLLSFGIFWFFLTLLPESSIIPIEDVIFEHRLYLPLFGYSLFLVSGLFYLFKCKKIRLIITVLSLIAIAYSIMTYERNKVWKDEFTLWNDAVKKSPRKARPHINRGMAYGIKEEYDRAIADFDKAIEIKPNSAEAYYNRAVAYKEKGDYTRAWQDIHKAESLGFKARPNFLDKLRSASGRED